MSIHIGSMLFAGKRYAAEVYPEKEVWGYADLAEVTFGIVGKVSHMTITCISFSHWANTQVLLGRILSNCVHVAIVVCDIVDLQGNLGYSATLMFLRQRSVAIQVSIVLPSYVMCVHDLPTDCSASDYSHPPVPGSHSLHDLCQRSGERVGLVVFIVKAAALFVWFLIVFLFVIWKTVRVLSYFVRCTLVRKCLLVVV